MSRKLERAPWMSDRGWQTHLDLMARHGDTTPNWLRDKPQWVQEAVRVLVVLLLLLVGVGVFCGAMTWLAVGSFALGVIAWGVIVGVLASLGRLGG